MSVTRIVRRNLQRAGEVKRFRLKDTSGEYGGLERVSIVLKRDGQRIRQFLRGWLDRRPRDKFGCLAGYCSEMAKKRREEGRA